MFHLGGILPVYASHQTSVCIHMLVLSIQLPLRRFAFSPVTRNYLEISYSCLVGGSAAPLGRNVFTWSHNGTIIDLLSPENVVVPGLGPLTSYFDLRMLWARWPSERKLPNRNEGRAPPSRFLSTLRFEQLGRTISVIPFRLPSYFRIPEHACVIILGVFVSP